MYSLSFQFNKCNLPFTLETNLSLPKLSNKILHHSGRSTLLLILVNTGNKEPCTLNTQVIFIKLPFDMRLFK